MGPQPVVCDLVARVLLDPAAAQALMDLVERTPELRHSLLAPPVVAGDPDFRRRTATVGPAVAAPPPGLEHLVPTAPASAAARAPAAAWPAAAIRTDVVSEQRASANPQKAARRMTLVLAYFPRGASDGAICSALDAALGEMSTVRRCRVVRDREGNGLYGFFEFQDPETAESALAACSRGSVVLSDEGGHMWHLRASRSERATVANSESSAARRRRGRRGGVAQHGVA
ncbi:unnamed protein product [Prorocentrum cordatum]|uniref:RRM domain-containing protein n=1 Tax=Prorocentrum cordatum TaxID=2364126 RepID=A0ABN9R9M3_9DINO|nr:unnamed protein product [Polarella glacialis]|mmetsp:Transcript_77348/g.219292  ORF Transcript_77348/g.219292 Transcript_77348/m.219292 type:complete len:229 (+) Transcript_77348:72-758(+)